MTGKLHVDIVDSGCVSTSSEDEVTVMDPIDPFGTSDAIRTEFHTLFACFPA